MANYTITTEQLKELYRDAKAECTGNIMTSLKEWFPTVFVPAKTYKIGQRFAVDKGSAVLLLCEPVLNHVALVDVETGTAYDFAKPVKDVEAITEAEMNHIVGYPFTLLPDTTDQMV